MTIFNISDRINNGEESFTQFKENIFDAKNYLKNLWRFQTQKAVP